MDKWTELRETIEELHENNAENQDIESVTRFLLNLMDVLDEKRAHHADQASCSPVPGDE